MGSTFIHTSGWASPDVEVPPVGGLWGVGIMMARLTHWEGSRKGLHTKGWLQSTNTAPTHLFFEQTTCPDMGPMW
jgi:hypothetical protein